jgi:hypothetical protein
VDAVTDLKHVTLLPWLLLEEGVSVPGFELMPYRRGSPLAGTEPTMAEALDKALACYVGSDLKPIQQTTLLRYADRNIVCPLSGEEKQEVLEFSELLAVAGLSARELCSHFSYWNRDYFRVTFEVLTGADGFVTVSSRRRDGVHLEMGSRDKAHVCRPSHVRPGTVSIDIPLLEALVASQSSERWPRILESLVNFNAANTDSGHTADRVELVLLCGAMERLLDVSGGKENELATGFCSRFPSQAPRTAEDCPRLERSDVGDRFRRVSTSTEAWIRDLFRLRGDFSHGRVEEKYPSVWDASEHLALGSIVYPLLLKSTLSEEGSYKLLPDDRGQAHSFELLLCIDELDHEAWVKVSQEAVWNQAKRDAARDLEAIRKGGGT